jgi:hypothetical protein
MNALVPNHFHLQQKTTIPTSKDIDLINIGSQVLAVCSIGLNRTGDKTHIHLWVYNLHSFNNDYGLFCKETDEETEVSKRIIQKK